MVGRIQHGPLRIRPLMCQTLALQCTQQVSIEIIKNLKFKKGVGIAIKSKETSSKLAI